MAKKKRYIVVPRTEAIKESGLQTGKGKLNFGTKTARWVDDPAVAKEIDTQHGLKGSGDVWVEQDENLEWHEQNDGMTDGKNLGIHHYTFQGIDIKQRGGNERVRVKTKDGYTFVSLAIAKEEGYKIVQKRRRTHGTRTS